MIGPDETPGPVELFAEMNAALARVKDAERVESEARKEHIHCRNRLNAAQKAIDKYLEGLRAKAPFDTHWTYNRRKEEPAE